MDQGQPQPSRRPGPGASPRGRPAPAVVAAIAGEDRRRRYRERIGERYTWVPNDSLEVLPHLLDGIVAAAVLVDLVRWTPVEAAPVLRELRQRWPALRIVGLYEPSAEALPEIVALARSDRRLAFACGADERLDMLLPEATATVTVESPSACQPLLEQLLPLAANAGLRATLAHLSLAPSHHWSIPALAAMHGWSEDAIERRFAEAGLVTPAVMRRLTAAAEGLWQVAAAKRPAREVAGALGLATADGLGRTILGVFGVGLRSARLMGAEGASGALATVGLLAQRRAGSSDI
jgi:hypothetical protein